ncbi:MAG: class I SAM-dependent methyltransferase [Verrucomicrobiota bacterium]|jgi:23S rRNA (cytosine1962-C5)-methyltransferase
MSVPTKTPALRLRLAPAAESLVRAGHPWVFAASVRRQNRPGKMGELAVIYDRHDEFLAAGLFDPDSPLRVRILHRGKPQPLDHDWWRRRLEQARSRRAGLFDEQTTGYRCIHGESDGWPGLALDRYDTTLALKLYTAAWLPRLPEVAGLLAAGENRIVLRLSRNIARAARAQFGYEDGQVLHGAAPDGPVVFLESGLRFEADVLRGQKTGFFLDQRENRRLVESLAAGRRVLNLFSYSGGFSLYAARGGAASVCSVDIRRQALAAAERNFARNRNFPAVAACRHEMAQADVFSWLREAAARRFDLVVLDPPALAKRQSERQEALRAYAGLLAGAVERLDAHGMLVAASCSAPVSARDFFDLAREAARQSGRGFEEWRATGHPPDHPVTFPEGEYLKCIYLRFR